MNCMERGLERMDEKELLKKISDNVIQGRVEAGDEGVEEGLEGQPAVTELVTEAVKQGIDPKTIVLQGLTTPMEEVGKKFEQGDYLIPDMLAAAECVGVAMDILSPHLLKLGVESKGKFITATVAGDVHDIGKNIVSIMLKGAGYEVIDIGNDVPTERIVKAVKDHNAPFLGMSALLTTTMRAMGDVIKKLEEEGIRSKVKVLIGGAPVSADFARQIKADAYCKDAFQAIEILKNVA